MSDNIIKAQALREAAERVATDKEFLPWCLDYQRDMAAAWLHERADEYLCEEEA